MCPISMTSLAKFFKIIHNKFDCVNSLINTRVRKLSVTVKAYILHKLAFVVYLVMRIKSTVTLLFMAFITKIRPALIGATSKKL